MENMDQSIKMSKELRTEKFLSNLMEIIEDEGYFPAEVNSRTEWGGLGSEWIWHNSPPRDMVEELKKTGSLWDKFRIKIAGVCRYIHPTRLSKPSESKFKEMRNYPKGMYNDTVGIIDMSVPNPYNSREKYGATIGSLEYDVDDKFIDGRIYGRENIPKLKELSNAIEDRLKKKVILTLSKEKALPANIFPEPILVGT